MALEDVNSQTLESVGSDLWQTANLAGLSISRVDSGVLEVADIREIYDLVVSVMGKELFDELRKVWIEFQSLSVPQIERAMELAKKWVELLREADPEGEPNGGGHAFAEVEESESGEGEGESGEGKSGEGRSGVMKKLIAQLSDSAFDTELNANDSLGDQETKEKWDEEVKARQSEAKNTNSRKAQAKEVFHKQHNQEGGNGSGSRVETRRPPTGAERASAVSIAKSLEKAKYRERSLHEVRSTLPQGKLKARAAVQNAALAARGSFERVPAWERKVRKHTDDPTLRLGVMVDISGSMGSASPPSSGSRSPPRRAIPALSRK
jgi:hypothetical protein